MTFNPKILPLTNQDLKEVSTNYLKSVIKNTDDEQLKNNCLEEIKERDQQRQKDLEKAAKHFRNALKIYPDHNKANKGLERITKQYLNMGNKSYKNGCY